MCKRTNKTEKNTEKKELLAMLHKIYIYLLYGKHKKILSKFHRFVRES